MSNQRLTLVDLEVISGHIEGVDFGPELYCIARSPRAVLVWDRGSMYTSGREQRYGESSLIGLPDRSPSFTRHPTWTHLGPRGGRLTVRRVADEADGIAKLFGADDLMVEICRAVREKRTLLIEGGGPMPMPARSQGASAFATWRGMVNRGWTSEPI